MSDPQLILGNGSRMDLIRDQEVALILTSPPYFPGTFEERLRKGRLSTKEIEEFGPAIQEFALGLRPVFSECLRVLKTDGVMIVQTRDVRLSDRLIGVEQIHRMLIESLGLVLYTRYLWRPKYTTKIRSQQLKVAHRLGGPRRRRMPGWPPPDRCVDPTKLQRPHLAVARTT